MHEFDLDRFLTAQAAVFENVIAELRAGKKTSHWMWYIFPQLRILGRSHKANYYGLENATESREYLSHPILGSRLRECSAILLSHRDLPVERIFGSIDARKLCSCATLFSSLSPPGSEFHKLLEKYFGALQCAKTIECLREECRPIRLF